MKPIGRGAPCRILLIGPLPPQVKSAAIPIGGGAVSFAEMVRELRDRHFDIEVVDSSRPRTYTSRHKVFQRDMAAFLKIVLESDEGIEAESISHILHISRSGVGGGGRNLGYVWNCAKTFSGEVFWR